MIEFLNPIRSVEKDISISRKIINTIFILLLGLALGTFSKYLDYKHADLKGLLMYIDEVVDLHNFLGGFSIWALLAICISIYSNPPARASLNVFVFFLAMVTSYYLYSNYIAGFFPKTYAMIWFGFTFLSPILAFISWYSKGKGRWSFIIASLILGVLFNMTFVFGQWYIDPISALDLPVFIIGLVVLRRDSLKDTILMSLSSIGFAILINNFFPFVR